MRARVRFQPALRWGIICLMLGLGAQVKATIHTDRSAFISASQNLRSYDFQSQPPTGSSFTIDTIVIDGIVFRGFGSIRIETDGPSNKRVRALSVGESARLTVDLPPGTTAVGFDELGLPVKVLTTTGEEFTFTNSAGTFVGFTSDVEIRSLTFSTLFTNQFAPDIYLDNLLVGQKNNGSQPIAPILFTDNQSGSPVALDSVTLVRDAFPIGSAVNFSADHRTRVTLFAVNVFLGPNDDRSTVRVQAEDAQHQFYDLPVEAINQTSLSWLTQITVSLTDELRNAGSSVDCTLSVRGAVSNKVAVHIQP